MSLRFTEIHAEPFVGLSLELEAGLHVALGQSSDGTARLIELCAGLSKPPEGRVELDHRQPYYSPELRARIGSLLPDARLPAVRTVSRYVAQILKMKGLSSDPGALLREWQLEALEEQSTESLDPGEARSLELALALHIASPLLLCLHHPFDTSLPRQRVIAKIKSAARAGATVVVTTNGMELNELLPANVLVLQGGRLLRAARAGSMSEIATGLMPTLVVVSSNTRGLASRLSQDPRITALTWDEASTPTLLRLWATDLGGVSRAVVEAAIQSEIEISYLGSEPPLLVSFQSAAYYETAQGPEHGAQGFLPT